MLNQNQFTKFTQYILLMRLHKPIGILLLLWPTLWALWLAGKGHPSLKVVVIFIVGVVLMRSAGCIINDFADRHFDAHVARTRERPLAANKISSFSALSLFVVLCLMAFFLVLFLNRLTMYLAFIGVFLAILYPFLKRFTHLPQLGLGLAFAWGVPMAFAALTNTIKGNVWLVFAAAAVWPIIYDTMYAMVDYADDIKIGVKSTAILFNGHYQMAIGMLQFIFLWLLILVGAHFKLHLSYFSSLVFAAALFGYQQWLIRDHVPEKCFKAFLNNQWVGLIIFIGIFLSYR